MHPNEYKKILADSGRLKSVSPESPEKSGIEPQRGSWQARAPPAGSQNQEWLRPPAAGEHLGGISTSTLAKWRLAGTGPAYSKAGRLVIYAKRDLDAYLSKRRRSSTSEEVET